MVHPDPSVLPPDVFALVEELHQAEFAYEQANDDVFQAERRIKAAKEEDAAELRDLLAAGKAAPKVIDKHERGSSAAHARARAIKTATHPQVDKAQRRLQSAVRSHLGEIEATAADAAHELGEKYRAALTEATRLRESLASKLDTWSDVPDASVSVSLAMTVGHGSRNLARPSSAASTNLQRFSRHWPKKTAFGTFRSRDTSRRPRKCLAPSAIASGSPMLATASVWIPTVFSLTRLLASRVSTPVARATFDALRDRSPVVVCISAAR